MRSTFMGLEASKRGLFTQQSALYTTGHNISNANTDGYSRQRVNMETTPGYPGVGLNSPKTAGHIGTGVQAQSVQRIRDEFIDRQYRQETNKLGYWESRTKSISSMEDVMSEPSEFGLNQAFTDFWKSMEDVVGNPKDTAARQVMISSAQTLTESFNYMDKQLKTIQGNIGNEINVISKDVNSLLKQIAQLNQQIAKLEPNGYMPNDLYDERDVLIDELNRYLPVSISTVKTGGNALAIAEGTVTIKFKPAGGGNEITLVDAEKYVSMAILDSDGNVLDGEVDDATNNSYKLFDQIVFSDLSINPSDAAITPANSVTYAELEPGKGSMLSLIDAYGHSGGVGLYPEMIDKLNTLAREFVIAFNDIHKNGHGLDAGSTGNDFFNGTTAFDIKVVLTDPKNIAVSDTEGEVGNNKNLLLLSKLQSDTQANLQGGTFQSYYKSLIGELGVNGKESIRQEHNFTTIQLQIQNNRDSVVKVSLDEEMTNMITFQQAYNANARMITVIDETLEKIINGMGRVGL